MARGPPGKVHDSHRIPPNGIAPLAAPYSILWPAPSGPGATTKAPVAGLTASAKGRDRFERFPTTWERCEAAPGAWTPTSELQRYRQFPSASARCDDSAALADYMRARASQGCSNRVESKCREGFVKTSVSLVDLCTEARNWLRLGGSDRKKEARRTRKKSGD